MAYLKSLKTHAGNFHNGIATPLKRRLAVPIHKQPACHTITRPPASPGHCAGTGHPPSAPDTLFQ